ncbi:protein YgfX [Dyella sedimenti]|uniref:protein YgfX n=1 Tax=Dyella sedimenti TaxID=2919947 RepID=UPI001FA9D753|nr:protein YgfX [Dyella sedimenti]
MTSAPAIGFEYRPSRWLRRVVWPLALLALCSLWLSAVPMAAKITLSLAAVAAVRRALARFGRTAVSAVGLGRDGNWTLHTRDGQDVPATLVGHRVLASQYVWLWLQASQLGRVPLLLGPDNSDADIRRRLRMRLAVAAAAEVPRHSFR